MELNGQKITPGGGIWVLELDENGDARDYSGYMFLAEVCGYVICSSYINDLQTVERTMEYHAEETAVNYDTDLAVFLKEDCFATRDEAAAHLGES